MENFGNIIYENLNQLKSFIFKTDDNINQYKQEHVENKFIIGLVEGSIFSLWPLIISSEVDYHQNAGCVTAAGLQFSAISALYEIWPNQITHGLIIASCGLIGEAYIQYQEL